MKVNGQRLMAAHYIIINPTLSVSVRKVVRPKQLGSASVSGASAMVITDYRCRR